MSAQAYRPWARDTGGRLLPAAPVRCTFRVLDPGGNRTWWSWWEYRVTYASGLKFAFIGPRDRVPQSRPAEAWGAFLDDLAARGEVAMHFPGCDTSRCHGCDGSRVGRENGVSVDAASNTPQIPNRPGGTVAKLSQKDRGMRLLRAARDVLTTYELILVEPGEVRLQGGRAPYTVRYCLEWSRTAECSCPDAERLVDEGYCKHVVAVLLSQPGLRAQLLEMFL